MFCFLLILLRAAHQICGIKIYYASAGFSKKQWMNEICKYPLGGFISWKHI